MALALAGLEDPTQAQARPGPFPQWCPGDFWDSGWGDNWNQISCHADGPGGPQALDPDFPGELPPQGSDSGDSGELAPQGSYPGGVEGLPPQGGDPGGPGESPPQGGDPGGAQSSGPGGIGEPPPL